MPTAAPETPVAPATPSPQTPPTPPPAPPTTPAPQDTKEIAGRLFKMLVDTKDEPVEAPKPDKKEEPAATPAVTPAAEKKPEAAEKPITQRKAKKPEPEKPPVVPKVESKPTPAPVEPRPATAPTQESDEAFEKGLLDEEREQLELARYAEKKFPEKYKGLGERTKKFLKDLAAKTGAEDFDETDPTYQKWLKESQPRLSPMEIRKLDEERITERVEKKFESKNDDIRHELYVRDETPKIKAEVDRIHSELSQIALPEDVRQAFEAKSKELGDPKKAVEAVQKEYALEFEIGENILKVATDDIEEFMRLTKTNTATGRNFKEMEKDAVVWDGAQEKWVPNVNSPNPAVQQHARILLMVSEICREFKESGGDALKRNGKWFATREELNGMPKEELKNWWTFTDKELIDLAMKRVPRAIDIACKQERERFEKRYGYTRQRAAALAPATPPVTPAPPPPSAPPAPRPAPVPGAGAPPATSMGAALAAKLQHQNS